MSDALTLTTKVEDLLDVAQNMQARVDANRQQLTDTYLDILERGHVIRYVNQATGLDERIGDTAGLPIRSIERALEQTPPGGVCDVYLQANYTVSVADIVIDNRTLRLFSDGAVKHVVAFTPYVYAVGATNYRGIYAFHVRGAANLMIRGLRIDVPAAEGAYLGYPQTSQSSPIHTTGVNDVGLKTVSIAFCEIDYPADGFGAITRIEGPFSLYVLSVTALDNPLTGFWMHDATNPAGVDVVAIPRLTSNLSQV